MRASGSEPFMYIKVTEENIVALTLWRNTLSRLYSLPLEINDYLLELGISFAHPPTFSGAKSTFKEVLLEEFLKPILHESQTDYFKRI